VLVPDTGACTTRSRPASGVQAGSAPEAEGDGRFERVMFNAARQGDARGNEGAAIVVLQAGLTRDRSTGPQRVVGGEVGFQQVQFVDLFFQLGSVGCRIDGLDQLPTARSGTSQWASGWPMALRLQPQIRIPI
jgi:hypothetical protein